MSDSEPLAADQLHQRCDPAAFDFETTDELEDLTAMVGQDRAVEAVEFGVEMDLYGYNLFVLGPPGSGKHSFVQRYLSQKAAAKPAASDWCYANNFDEPRKPIALELPAGWGRALRDDIDRLVDEAYTAIPSAFESEDYRARRQAIEKAFQAAQTKRFQEIQSRARERGIAVIQTPTGVELVPVRDGKPMAPQEIEALPAQERQRLQQETEELGGEIQQAIQGMPSLIRDVRDKIRELDREIAMLAAGGLIDDLTEKYAEHRKVVDYLTSVQADMIENVALFLGQREGGGGGGGAGSGGERHALSIQQPKEAAAKRRYCINLLVGREADGGAPLVFENHPTYQNLVGEIEYLAQMGALVTDFSLIKSGALHRANGGYLVLDAHKILTEPFAWQGLKQALKSREIRIESLGEAYSLIRTATLEPEPIPLDLKIILIGERRLYYLLQAYDPEFMELFKVAADFDDRMPRNAETNRLFAQLLGGVARQDGLRPLDRTGVARLIDESARHAAHAGKLSATVRRTADIMREANYWAERHGAEAVDGDAVEAAVQARIRRASRLRDRLQEEVLEETLLIDTEGAATGQVNGLAVLELGDFSFARPNRITARVALGSGKVLDIEREAKLGGPLHSKGVLILSGYLAGRYGGETPLSLAASLVLEQSYGGVEGDSASSAELYALLSALAEAPIRQGLAVTGSVNQHGRVQAIGGVNQKIEGFFEVCAARGLTGDQGVLIPAANVKHLMLRRPVVEAVEAGRFAIYPIATIDQGIALLTGLEAGAPGADGRFPEGSLNRRVMDRLAAFAAARKAFGAEEKAQGDKAGS
ncbi:MAG: AAA family ATPase [Alphaproteobacteria bacterium]|nr:AAA family ATPase [Alphaproteobacteria bacterium]